MNISQLPCDILSIIINNLDGFDITSTWMCGNKHLNHLLSSVKGIVDTFNVTFSSESMSETIEPIKIIKKFKHLKKFIYNHESFGICSIRKNEKVDWSFPPSLTHLNIILPYDNIFTESSLIELPRNLTYLDLNDGTITDALIEYLPTTLTHLSLIWNYRLTDSCIKHLPRSLIHLNLYNNREFTDLNIEHLPICLTYLNLC